MLKRFSSPFLLAAVLAGCGTSPSEVAEVRLSSTDLILEQDSSATLSAIARDAAGNPLAGRTVAWSSSQATIAEVDQTGQVTGITPGVTTITATIEQRADTAVVTVLSRGVRKVVNVVDSTRLRLLVDSASQAAGTFTFEVLSGAPQGSLAVGQVLVGAQGRGFLRRITALQANGALLTVSTAEAALTDAVREGRVAGTTRLSLPFGVGGNARPREWSYGEIQWGEPSVVAASGPIVIRNGEIELDEVVLYNDGAGTVLRFTDGRIKFEPDFSLDLAISGGAIDRLEANATGTLSFDGDYELAVNGASASISREVTLFIVSRPFYAYFGVFPFGVPLVGVVSLEFKGTVGLSASARASLRTGFRTQGTVTVGGRYVRAASPAWDLFTSSSAGFAPVPLTADAAIGVSAEAGLKSELRLSLYGVAGPYLFSHATAQASRTIDLIAQMQRDLCVGRLDAGVGFDVRILSYALVRFEEQRNLVTIPFCSVDTPLNPSVPLTGRVYHALTNGNLAGVSITVTRLGATVATTQTNAQGIWTVNVPDNNTYDVTASAVGFVTARILAQPVAGPTTALPIPLVPSSTFPGGIAGRLLNATNNGAIAGGTMDLRAGINATAGSALATATTNASGDYTFSNLAAGTYSVRGNAGGFIAGTRTGIVVGGTTVTGQDVVLSPFGVASAVRIVLTWGATPSDLDSHLTGPVPGSATRFHVYYSSKGNCNASPFACLDVDDVTAFGPETVTVTQLFNGTYRYSVQNYSAAGNGGDAFDGTLAASNARVDVYTNNALRASFAVPQQLGTLWTVFVMDQAGTITPVNTISGTPPGTGALRARGTAPIDDADLITAASSANRKPLPTP